MEKNLDLEEIRPSVAEPEQKEAIVMSRESADSFLSFLENSGRTKQTVDTYRRCLSRLFSFLPDDKKISADTLRQWREAMQTEGRAVRSLNLHISAANSYLEFLGQKEFQLRPLLYESPPKEMPALTWSEYLRLLQTARTLGNKRAEMLIKVFCETGIRLREVPNITLEAVNAGEIVTEPGIRPKCVPLSPELREELRDYADSVGVLSGSLFVRQSGEPLDHSEILLIIVKLFKKADVPREKATTRTLRRFHRDWATRDRIHAEVAEQVKEIYESLLTRGRSFTT